MSFLLYLQQMARSKQTSNKANQIGPNPAKLSLKYSRKTACSSGGKKRPHLHPRMFRLDKKKETKTKRRRVEEGPREAGKINK